MIKTLVFAGIALAIGGGFVYFSPDAPTPLTTNKASSTGSIEKAVEVPSIISSPFDTVATDRETKSLGASEQQIVAEEQSTAEIADKQKAQRIATEAARSTAAYELAINDLNDEQIHDFALRLKTDPAFLQAVADEFRSESDPARLKRLSFLLGEAQDPLLTPVATDMVYSGSRESELAGLDLLRRLQPVDPTARDTVMNILASDADSEVLVGALNVLVLTGQASKDERQAVVDHILPLISSDSAAVRQRSMSMVAKWASADTASDTLLTGLNDVDESVRKTAAFATMKVKNANPELIEALFLVLENKDEYIQARKGAGLSLKGKHLNEAKQLRLEKAYAQMRKQYARKP